MSEKIVAVAAGKEITENEFKEFLTRIPEQQAQYVNTPEGRKQALTQYANYFLFEKLAQENNYEQSEEFIAMLAGVKRELLSQFALTQLVKDITATEEEGRAYYEEHQSMFKKGAQATAKHILTSTEEEAQKVLKEIEEGEKTFEEAAKVYSSCPSKDQGGSLGTFGRGQMVKEFDDAVFTAEPGKLIGPVKTQFGYHLIFVDALTGDTAATFEETAPQIMQQLVNEKQNKVYMEERERLIKDYGFEIK